MTTPSRVGTTLHPARWSLRTRLLTTVVGLTALVCLALGVLSTVALQHFLLGRLDDQLVAATSRSQTADGQPPTGGGTASSGTAGGARFVVTPGQPAGTLGARVTDGTVTAVGVLREDGSLAVVPAAGAAVLADLPTDGETVTREVAGAGSFRLLATRTADGDVLVTGLPLREVDATLYRLVAVEALVGGLALVGGGLAAAVIVRRTLRPLDRVAAIATRVSSLPLEQGEVDLAERVPAADTDPRTEVGQVGGALNLMLDHVSGALTARQASETRVRQFVADASHELRTPLASIRGYAELTRLSRVQAPPDLAHAMGRVESEATRMTALVEDLLLLARLDAGRPLDSEPVDLTALVVDAVGDASAAGRDHAWRLELPDEPVTVFGDAARLHQVLVNLLANARTHTPPGTVVTTSLTTSAPGQVALTVVDDGPGIPAALLPDVFDRFARGDASRVRGAGSTGLGLAIVQAIVASSGGSVLVTSRPGQTAFLVCLPVASAARLVMAAGS